MRKFGTLELELKNRLFDPLCLSMYGLEVFLSKRNCVSDLKKLGVAYHFAVKRPWGFRNILPIIMSVVCITDLPLSI